jgi:ABC-type Mn2+/Zn2+ transport system permease subunit
MDLLDFLSFQFMQRAVITGIFLGFLLAGLGVFVALRNMAFFGEGVAHASLAGIALAILTGVSPLPIAMLWAVVLALLIFFLENKTKLSIDTMIGIFFTSSMALGVILMNFTTGYQPELISFLFGSILAVSPSDLMIIGLCTVVIMSWLFLSKRQLTLMSLSEDQAAVSGVPVRLQTALFYVALALATVLGVKILGIILISALLIIPPAISRMATESFRWYFFWSILFSELIIFFGLAFSFYLDFPSGATIVLLGTLVFFVMAIWKTLHTSR